MNVMRWIAAALGLAICGLSQALDPLLWGSYLLHGPVSRVFHNRQAAEVRRNYDRLARTMRAFFDSHLRGQRQAWETMLRETNGEFQLTERSK